MRILVVSTPGVGHLLPLLPLARVARERGHDVRVASGVGLAGIVASAGFELVEIGPPTIDAVVATQPWAPEATGRRRAVLTFREVFCGRLAADQSTDLLAATDVWRPDLVVREDMAHAGWLVAQRLGIPQVTVQVTAWRPRMRDLATEPLGALREGLGLPPDPELATLYGDGLFLARPRSLVDPAAGLPANTAELRPVADDDVDADGASAQDLPDPQGRPRIAVTLGTVNRRRHDVLRPIIEGADAAGAQVIVALGDDPAVLAPVPAGAWVGRYVPMSALVATSDVVAFHGGSGTMLAALAAGRPLLVVPLAADQPDNAERCAAIGVAIVIEPEALSANAVRTAIESILGDPRYRRRASEVAAEIAAMPGPDAAVLRLERIGAGQLPDRLP
jgi:UDP:flavonoid glycosyltransferase YjiC (YdhE family)